MKIYAREFMIFIDPRGWKTKEIKETLY